MSNKMIPFFLLCETPMHVGIGSDVGVVDMPIQRERHTGWPKIEASGLKGSIRAAFEKRYKKDNEKLKDINVAFGYDDNGMNEELKTYFKDEKEFSGALGFTDARILLFPVKSMKGVFAWITCPAVLERLFNDLRIAGIDIKNKIEEFELKENIINFESTCIAKKNNDNNIDKVVLEEYTEEVEENSICQKLNRWLSKNILSEDSIYKLLKEKMEKDVIVLSNELFTEFTNLSTEVITRTKIDNSTGTVKGGALFTEEYLPAETVMYSFAMISPIFSSKKGSFEDDGEDSETQIEKIERFFKDGLEGIIQIGGNSNLGKGIVSTKIFEKEGGK